MLAAARGKYPKEAVAVKELGPEHTHNVGRGCGLRCMQDICCDGGIMAMGGWNDNIGYKSYTE